MEIRLVLIDSFLFQNMQSRGRPAIFILIEVRTWTAGTAGMHSQGNPSSTLGWEGRTAMVWTISAQPHWCGKGRGRVDRTLSLWPRPLQTHRLHQKSSQMRCDTDDVMAAGLRRWENQILWQRLLSLCSKANTEHGGSHVLWWDVWLLCPLGPQEERRC